jgi:hypothetical protein
LIWPKLPAAISGVVFGGETFASWRGGRFPGGRFLQLSQGVFADARQKAWFLVAKHSPVGGAGVFSGINAAASLGGA